MTATWETFKPRYRAKPSRLDLDADLLTDELDRDEQADIDRMLTIRHARNAGWQPHELRSHTNTSRLLGDRPMTGTERTAKHRPHAPPPPTFTPPTDAACIGALDIFYDEEHTHALAACRTCPAHTPCRYAALEVAVSDQFGVQGGLTAAERITIRRRWTRINPAPMRERRTDALAESVRLRNQTNGEHRTEAG